jgi:hypothetical protein
LIAVAALALLTSGAAGEPRAAIPADAVPAVALGRVEFIPTGPDGLAQFEISGPPTAGVLHLGLRPPPGSLLVTEDDQVLDPVDLDVEDDLLSVTLKVEGAGRLWVVTGTAAERALQVLAVLEPDNDAGATDAATPAGFPSNAVIDALSRLAGRRSVSWFSRARLGPWLVPHREADLPPLPGCDRQVTAAGFKPCARESLAAIWDCFANQGLTTRAAPKTLAVYLDDRIAYRAARAAAAGADCAQVLTLKADRASQERAGQIVAAAFTAGPGAAPPPAHAAPAVSSATVPFGEIQPEEAGIPSRREAEVGGFIAALQGSCAGESLVDALRDAGETGLDSKVSLLVHEIAKGVEAWTGRLPDESDGRLIEAARALEGLPRGPGCDPVVAVMALTDEWSRRVAEGLSTHGTAERFIAAFREAEKEQGADLPAWLPERFPLLYRDAQRILKYLA